jgi:hypothetical protein
MGEYLLTPGCSDIERWRSSLSALPKTVKDAIAVAKIFGFSHIWIDGYCIDQQNVEEVNDQISQMHDIYRQADLTIIAACGLDSEYGLPGVSIPRRKIKRTTIGQWRFLEILVFQAHHTIPYSKWNPRDWTYQEAMFSRRRIFFTDQMLSLSAGPCSGGNLPMLRSDMKIRWIKAPCHT